MPCHFPSVLSLLTLCEQKWELSESDQDMSDFIYAIVACSVSQYQIFFITESVHVVEVTFATARNLSFLIFYITLHCPWGTLSAAQTPFRRFIRYLAILLKKKKKGWFPSWIPEKVGCGCQVFYLSAAVCRCVLTMLFVTDGVLCWIHPAVVLLKWWSWEWQPGR